MKKQSCRNCHNIELNKKEETENNQMKAEWTLPLWLHRAKKWVYMRLYYQ